MPPTSLSPFHHDVLRRLRDAGHIGLAEEAHEQWTLGCALENVFVGGDPQLHADFTRANAEWAKHGPVRS